MDGRACDKVPLAEPVWLAASRKPDSRALIQRDSEAQKCHQVPWQRTHARFVSQAAVDGGLQERKPLNSSPSGNQSTPCLILSVKAVKDPVAVDFETNVVISLKQPSLQVQPHQAETDTGVAAPRRTAVNLTAHLSV
ncbi:hypothetical protein ROHU_015678 [Labeo rohita]|uniref:Uncharacterized protein n=1 Tax=Labeo rohita TaxID=84645 RepID=A0A498NNW7_LABRO|nr:hypothetical protein ROHU_015678 [Labeo rohita]